MDASSLAISLRQLIHRKVAGKAVGEWNYVCTLSGEERNKKTEILEVVRTNNPEGWAKLNQCGGTKEEITMNALELVAKVPFRTISPYDINSRIMDIEPENADKGVSNEDYEATKGLGVYKYSCVKCSKMFIKAQPCLNHMTSVCSIAPNDIPKKVRERAWRNALKSGAMIKAMQIKRDRITKPSEEELVKRIQALHVANPEIKITSTAKHLGNIYGRKNFESYGYGKITDFAKKHNLM